MAHKVFQQGSRTVAQNTSDSVKQLISISDVFQLGAIIKFNPGTRPHNEYS